MNSFLKYIHSSMNNLLGCSAHDFGKLYLLPVSLFFVFFIFFSCGNSDNPQFTEKQRSEMDSLVNSDRSFESINAKIAKFSKENNKLGLAVCFDEMGKLYRENSRFTEAIIYHKKELELASKICDTLDVIKALNNIGTNYRRMGVLDEATTFHYRALTLCSVYSDKSNKELKKDRVVSLNGLGNVYITLGNNELADSIFRVALQGEKELGSPLGQAINYANIGSIMESRGQIDSAWIYYKKSMVMNQKAKSDLGIALCNLNFGRLYENAGKYDDAIKEFLSAYDLMQKGCDSWHWLEACIALSRVNITKGDMAQARKYLNLAQDKADSIHSLEHLASVAMQNYRWSQHQGDCRAALQYYIKSHTYSDSLNNEKNLNHIQNVRVGYERDKRQGELDNMQQNYQTEQRLKNIFIYAGIIILLMSGIVVAFLWYALRMRSRSQKAMRQMERTRTNFFTNITHEFRTPLTVILGLGHQIQDGKVHDEENLKSMGRAIVRQGDSLLELINQLLDIAKVRSAIGEPDWRTGDAVAYIRMIAENYQSYASQQRIELTYVPAETSVTMDFVPDYLRKIMRNLLSNALKYTPEYGKIFITTKLTGDNIIIRVADTGVGIDKKDLPHIFEAFFQTDNSSKHLGTGIGLSLVKQIVTNMDGKITVSSDVGIGSVFTVTLPIKHGKGRFEKFLGYADAEAVDTNHISSDNTDVELPEGMQEGSSVPSILIVEDNTDVSYYIGTQLKEQYNLFYAKNGEEGLERAGELMPDLIITDLMMPGVDGYELCRQIRSSEILSHIPIIIISAKSTEADRVKGFEVGADAYLYKPFNSDELNIRVTKLLDMRHQLREKYSRAMDEGKEQTVQLAESDQQFLNKLVDIIYSQMSNGEMDTETIASKIFMSRSQLNRKILAITGYNTAAYILRTRMGRAMRMLAKDDITPISDIADKCGFMDYSYFTRIFKQLYKMTPTQYRKRAKV